MMTPKALLVSLALLGAAQVIEANPLRLPKHDLCDKACKQAGADAYLTALVSHDKKTVRTREFSDTTT